MSEGRIGVIGGSGLYAMAALENVTELQVETPFGAPSDAFILGTLGDRDMVFLPRHGRGHRIPPSAINFRANLYGMKSLGVEWVISVSAVGSMRENIHPGDVILPDQFFDRTRSVMTKALEQAVVAAGAKVHAGGTYLCIEGPQFSTRAESEIYRQWGVDVIGMTNLPEARLAREAELCYATMALCTDYDCWHDSASDVDIGAILEVLQRNVRLAQDIIARTVPALQGDRQCQCSTALQYALITDPAMIPQAARERLGLLVDPYLS